MYAVIATGGKQYKVSEGDVIYVEKLDAEKDSEVTFDQVLAVGGEKMTVGSPLVDSASVTGKVLEQGSPGQVFGAPQHPRLRDFLSKVLI